MAYASHFQGRRVSGSNRWPEQTADVFRILVDNKMVVGFELDRNNFDAPPTDVQRYTVPDFRKVVGGLANAELRVALELPRRERAR